MVQDHLSFFPSQRGTREAPIVDVRAAEIRCFKSEKTGYQLLLLNQIGI
jgi:hypothetical protein